VWKIFIDTQSFLKRVFNKGKLSIKQESIEICKSYLLNSEDCIQSAKLLNNNKLHKNSIIMSYYSMYNALQALLFRTGIKCENHTASIILLKLLFDEKELFVIIKSAKKQRIEKQYYVNTTENNESIKKTAIELINKDEYFFNSIKIAIKTLNRNKIDNIKNKLDKLLQ